MSVCKWCGEKIKGADECETCVVLRREIEDRPEVARKMLERITLLEKAKKAIKNALKQGCYIVTLGGKLVDDPEWLADLWQAKVTLSTVDIDMEKGEEQLKQLKEED